MHLNKLLSDLWNRWQTEYLMELRNNHQYVGETSDENPVRVGDVLLVHNTNQEVSGSLPESLNSYQDRMDV